MNFFLANFRKNFPRRNWLKLFVDSAYKHTDAQDWNNKTRQERGKAKVHASARTEAFLSSTFKF